MLASLVHSAIRPASPEQGLSNTVSLSPEVTDLPTSGSWKVEVCQKKKKNLEETINQQSAARSTSKKYEATQTYLSVKYQHNRLHLTGKRPQQRSQDHSNNKAHRLLYFSKTSSRGKKAPNAYDAIWDESVPLTGFFRQYCRLITTLAWRSLTTGGTISFSFVFCVENVRYTLIPCHEIYHRQKACCV